MLRLCARAKREYSVTCLLLHELTSLFVLYVSLILDTAEYRRKEWLLYFKRSYVERNNGMFAVSRCTCRTVSKFS
jgi:hypothetical protein